MYLFLTLGNTIPTLSRRTLQADYTSPAGEHFPWHASILRRYPLIMLDWTRRRAEALYIGLRPMLRNSARVATMQVEIMTIVRHGFGWPSLADPLD